MIHGMFIDKGLSDWQIVQQTEGSADVSFEGKWILIKDAVKQGIECVQPKIRIYKEDDNSVVLDWVDADYTKETDSYTGTWSVKLSIPAGGLYRVETGLYAKCVKPGVEWTFRGDTCLHIGVGDLFVIAGQSNSAGYAKDSAQDSPSMGVHLLRNRGTWDIATHPMNEATGAPDAPNAERGNPGVSPYLSFGKKFMEFSGYPVGLIQTSMGGLGIRKWESDNSSMFVNMVEKTKSAGQVAGILWYQGCSDTYIDNCDAYEERYYSLINRFRKAIGYEVRFFTFQLNRMISGENDPGWGIVRDVQRRAVHDLENVYVLPTTNESVCDEIHNSAHSCIHIGENMARLCAHVIYNTTEFFAPDINSSYLNGSLLTIQFNNVYGHIIMRSSAFKDCGIYVEDETGIIEYDKAFTENDKPDSVFIELKREPIGFVYISMAWEADPTYYAPIDSSTHLPALSFYKFRVEKRSKT